MSNVSVDGHCDPAFLPVLETFRENFHTRGEIGASCCLIYGGKKVVDIWGGHKDSAKKNPWQEDTLSLVFSCTKAAVALCAHLLIDQGKLNLDAKVTDFWPEFGQHGKDNITVRMMLSHQSAVPAVRAPVRLGGYYDFDYMATRVADEKPFWTPGVKNGYHMITFGWTVGELVRRVSGQSLGEFFKTRIAEPLGLDFHIGLDEADFERTAKMIPYVPNPADIISRFARALMGSKESVQFLCLLNTGGYYFDSPKAWRAEIGGGGGIANARALAKMFAALTGPKPFLSKARIEDMRAPSAETQEDETLLIPTRFGQGFMLSMDNRHLDGEGNSAILGNGAFGHVGMGGSIGFADIDANIGFGYTMVKMGGGILLNSRGQALVDAVYSALGYSGITEGAWHP